MYGYDDDYDPIMNEYDYRQELFGGDEELDPADYEDDGQPSDIQEQQDFARDDLPEPPDDYYGAEDRALDQAYEERYELYEQPYDCYPDD